MGDNMDIINRPLKYFLLILLLLAGGRTLAQNPRGAERLFAEKQYKEAADIYAKLVRRYPGSAAYNYFYGACLYETGDAEGAIPYLKRACKRRYINAFRYMGMANSSRYRFDEAAADYESYIHYLQQRRRDTSEAEAELSQIRMKARMMRGVKDIQLVDTFAVGKRDFLDCFRLSPEAGSLSPAPHNDGTIFETALGNMRLIGDTTQTGERVIRQQNKVFDEWSEPETISSLCSYGNVATPYLMGDGLTLYFASDMEGGLGGYDIYITRYDSDEGAYLKPGNLGMPFNSQADDYMLAIDETEGLGWFVSNRFQPEDSVCVYVFVPSQKIVDYDETPAPQMRARASLRPASASAAAEDMLREARKRLSALSSSAKDNKDMAHKSSATSTPEFSDPETNACYGRLKTLRSDLEDMEAEIFGLRKRYHDGDEIVRGNIKDRLLDLENRVEGLRKEVKQQEKKFRILKTTNTDK